MNKGENRIGTISSIDIDTGMVSVVYEDRDNEVTDLLPYATFNDEYKLPTIGDKVVVLHLSNGGEMGVVLGTYWNESNAAGYRGTYHKCLGDGAYIDYNNKTLVIEAGHILFRASEDHADFSVAKIMEDINAIKQKLGLI